MKILIIQLARLGDIYQTWPVVNSIKRTHPKAKIHFLARKKFAPACEGLSAIDQVWSLDTRAVLEPLIDEQPKFQKSIDQVDDLLNKLRTEKFDKVINLSFSPLSSYLTHTLELSGSTVTGYSRHSDGFFNPVDDASAYFFSQVGPGKPNRVHLTDLFSQVAGVELRDEDWNAGKYPTSKFSKVGAVVVHLGASESKKTYGTHRWLQIVKTILEKSNREVLLIGSNEERDLGFVVENVTSVRRPINLVGQTQLPELFDILSQASMLIGCDSAPVHIAALTQTPVLNLSFSSVNFWETGPKSAGSRILISESPESLSSDRVSEECIAMLAARNTSSGAVIVPQARTQSYITTSGELAGLPEWEMIQAIYMGAPFPVLPNRIFREAIVRLYETNELAIDQVRALRNRPNNKVAVSILQRIDEIYQTIEKMLPTIGVLVRWFQTERIRLGAIKQTELLDATEALHMKLRDILLMYSPETEGGRHDNVGVG